jgi:hypothetical protein
LNTTTGSVAPRLGELLQHWGRRSLSSSSRRARRAGRFEIAGHLDAPLEIVLVCKIGVPWQPELALGAVVDGSKPQVIINEALAA